MLNDAKVQTLRQAPLDGRNKVRLAMTLAGVNQTEVAKALGVSQSSISDIARGDYSDLPLTTAQAWATLFGVTVEDIFPAPVRDQAVSA